MHWVANADSRPNRAKGRSRLAELIVPQRWWLTQIPRLGKRSEGETTSETDAGTRARRSKPRGRPPFCAARRATAAGRGPGGGVAFLPPSRAGSQCDTGHVLLV